MKTIVLHVPDEADEAAVLAALAKLLDKKLIELDTDLPLSWPGPPLTADAYADKLGQALAACQPKTQKNAWGYDSKRPDRFAG